MIGQGRMAQPAFCRHKWRRFRDSNREVSQEGSATTSGTSLGVQLLVAGDEGEVGFGGDMGLAAVLLKVLLARERGRH